MVGVELFVEGGGDHKELKIECRRAFRTLLERAGLDGRLPRVFASGSRTQAYGDFCTAIKGKASRPALLVDSEGPVDSETAWTHLLARDGWKRPEGASEDQCHLMVQLMESWLLADPKAVGQFFGKGFDESKLPARKAVEEIPKPEVLDALRKAANGTLIGTYEKRDGFRILEKVDPNKVRRVSPWGDRFFEAMDRLTGL